MSLRGFFKIIYKKLWIIMSVPFLAAIISLILCSFVIKPVYQATETFYVVSSNMNNTGSYDSIMVDQQMLRDYREIIKSNYITTEVLKMLGSDNEKMRENISKRVSVELKNDTRILALSVSDPDPGTAKKLAETFGLVFISRVRAWMNVENISIIDHAETPRKPISPDKFLITLLSAVISLLITTGTIFFIEYLDDTVKTVEDIEMYMGTVVLGTIPDFKI